MFRLVLFLILVLVVPVGALGHTITATFTHPGPDVEGFKLYDNGVFLCPSTDPSSRTLVCEANLGFGAHSFTLTAYSGDQESLHSNAFPMVITLTSPSLGTVTVED